MRDRKDELQSLPVYESHPPEWLPRVHVSADLGYAGFHPPRPGQDEDVLSEANVKNGFVLGHHVPAESFSAQSMINEDLRSSDTLSKLEGLMNEIFVRRADRIPSIPPSTFRIPTRVTLNDSKRQAWFADLANPDVPLHKLGKSVPHGAKGHDLLDLLQSNNVAIPRAVWFLRVFGANETAGLRNKPSYNPIQYSVDWANVVTSYMKKQLADIALPSAPRPGLNIKQTFKGVLADADSRERWISRFTYCLKLLRTFYSEGLVDNHTFLVWVVQQMGACNLAQAGFITRLADEYLDGMVGSRALTRPFIDACLCKIAEIRSTSAQEFLSNTEGLLKTLLQRLCLAFPDSFVSPRMWTAYSTLLSMILTENIIDHSNDQLLEQNSRDIHQVLLDNFSDIKKRNEAMLFRSLPVRTSVRLGSAVSDVKLLNSISSTTDLDALPFFVNLPDDQPGFIEKLDMLLTWCVTPLQYGDHRPFAAVTLISNWRARAGDRATRRNFTPPDEFLQDHLFEWLDSSDISGDPDNIRAVALLFGKLVKHELFSYSSYIQRLIARGEPGLSYTEDNGSRHRNFLKWIPLYKSTSSLTNQRKVTLYGARARETPEDTNEREIRKEIRAVLPGIFEGEAQTSATSTTALSDDCSILLAATRFEQVRIFRQWLLPILQKRIACRGSEISQPAFLKSYCVAVELMTYANCFQSILDLTLSLLEHSTAVDSLVVVIDTLHRFATIWTCMNAVGSVVAALDAAHQVWKIRGIQSRLLLSFLVEFDNGRYLSEASRERITAEITAFTLALQPMTEHHDVVPDVLPEILLLADDPEENAPSLLANSLWIKYRMSYDWAWKVWDNTVASLRQVPVMTSDVGGRSACALRYGTFLWHVDQHLAMGLDDQVLRWFLGPGKNEVTALSSDAWDVLTVVLLYLSVHGALKSTTILTGLVYPAWQLAASASTEQQGHAIETFLRSANNLCQRLLLLQDVNRTNIPRIDLHDIQRIQTRRQDVYCVPHFSLLVTSIPLLIFVENNSHVPEICRSDSMSLRHALCRDRAFRQGAYRNLDAIREAFEHSLQLADGTPGNLGGHVVSGLRMLLGDVTDDIELSEWPAVTCLLSPWKIAATTIQLQLILKEMGRRLSQESTHQTASADLDKLIVMLFRHSMTSEEAYYVGEMTRGVDSAVAGKFVNNGLKCIAEILQETVAASEILSERFRRAGELLRVLIYVAEPFREEPSLLPNLEPSIQEAFLDALHTQFALIESLVSSGRTTKRYPSQLTHGTVLMLRLLQFELGFRSICTSKTKETSDDLSSSLFNLALLYGTSDNLDPAVYALFADTLYYLYDEIPPDAKTLTFDPFRNYPNMLISDLPPELPTEYRNQIVTLLPHLPPVASVSDLVNSHRDSAGNLVHDTPVINRPWEWIENLGDPSVLDSKEEERERGEKARLKMKYLVKNSGSLSLDTFGARMTGDGILQNADQEIDARIEGNIRTFEDGLSAESVFKRDWRETRVELEDELLIGHPIGRPKGEIVHEPSGSTVYSALRQEKRSTPRGSPASSVISRSSARGSTASLRQSPAQGSINKHSNSTMSEVIDVDSIATASSSKRATTNKRKAATAMTTASDDEIEIIEGPVPVRATSSKKTRARASTKTRAKKR